MSRLIDADELLEFYEDIQIDEPGDVDFLVVPLGVIKQNIKDQPTIDPESLRPRGRWDYYSPTMQECSACKRHTPRHRYAYCPHCGAKMEE